jgi:hypothetical protein
MEAAAVKDKPETTVIVADKPYSKREDEATTGVPAPTNLMQALAIAAADPRMEIAKVEKLWAMHKEMKAAAAKEAFVAAVAAFKANPPTVYKDKTNSQYGSRYTSIGNLVNTVNAALSPHGLTARWNIAQEQHITVTCFLTHALGHSESCSLTAPADTSGQKNPLQQIKSTVTYLKLATFEAVTGVASADGNADDDGNGAASMPESEVQGFIAQIKKATTKEKAKAAWRAGVKACEAIGDRETAEALKKEMLDHCAFIDTASKE